MALRDIGYFCAPAACCVEAELEVLPYFYGGLVVIRVLACYSCRNTRKGGAYDSDWTGSAGGAHQFAGRVARVGAARDSAGEFVLIFGMYFAAENDPTAAGGTAAGWNLASWALFRI